MSVRPDHRTATAVSNGEEFSLPDRTAAQELISDLDTTTPEPQTANSLALRSLAQGAAEENSLHHHPHETSHAESLESVQLPLHEIRAFPKHENVSRASRIPRAVITPAGAKSKHDHHPHGEQRSRVALSQNRITNRPLSKKTLFARVARFLRGDASREEPSSTFDRLMNWLAGLLEQLDRQFSGRSQDAQNTFALQEMQRIQKLRAAAEREAREKAENLTPTVSSQSPEEEEEIR